jgi:hypothetical protein
LLGVGALRLAIGPRLSCIKHSRQMRNRAGQLVSWAEAGCGRLRFSIDEKRLAECPAQEIGIALFPALPWVERMTRFGRRSVGIVGRVLSVG